MLREIPFNDAPEPETAKGWHHQPHGIANAAARAP